MKQLLFTFLSIILLSNFVLAQDQIGPQLKSGSKAPVDNMVDLKGNKLKFNDLLKDNKKILVCFLRPVWCPVCNKRTHELIDEYSKLKEKGYEVLVVYPTPEATLKEYVGNLKIPFIVVSDYKETLYNAFMVEKSSKKFLKSIFTKASMKMGKEGAKLYKGKKYPVKGDKHGPIIPADFVIEKNNILLNVYYGEYNGDHLPLDTL